MERKYILSIDQSTQATKGLLFDETGALIHRVDKVHKQIINELGHVSHNPEEIYENVLYVIKAVVEESKINKDSIVGLGISNQRETSLIWDKKTGKSLENAIVWQCQRASSICNRQEILNHAEIIRKKTGLTLSPYFPAAKFTWLMEKTGKKEACFGTVDSYLIYRLTNGISYKTDYSNASRTQLFNIHTLKWDNEICGLFGINPKNLAQVVDSNSIFGETDFEGYLQHKIPILAVLGDSHAALFGQGCLESGMTKTTYGTGSSIMMNIGKEYVESKHGVVTSLAWGINGTVNYVLEGNLNYTGATITWLKDDLKLIETATETEELANIANKEDQLYLVPAFTGLGAPYWNSEAKAIICGMDRTTKKAELVRAALESIAYQIRDIIEAMQEDSKIEIKKLKVDGGPTKNGYLMKFQSDILNKEVSVPAGEELSGIGVAYMAGLSLNMWDQTIFTKMDSISYYPQMKEQVRDKKVLGWKKAVKLVVQ